MYDCIVVGDAMIDVVLRSDSQILRSLNIEGTNYFSECRITPGGSGNLSAGISSLGGKAAFIGKAGDDSYGRSYQEDLDSLHIASGLEFDSAKSTGLAVCLVEPQGKRTMLVSRGANDALTREEVRENLRKLLPAQFVYISGYSLPNSPQRDAVLQAARIGHGSGSRVVFDPGSSNLIQEFPSLFKIAVEQCDILCSNLQEAKALGGDMGVRQYASLLSQSRKIVLVKMGPRGCLVASRGNITRVPGVPARSVDTTGAGDAFLGAFVYCLSRGLVPAISAAFGNWFASRKIQGLGPRHFPPKREAMSYLAKLSRAKTNA